MSDDGKKQRIDLFLAAIVGALASKLLDLLVSTIYPQFLSAAIVGKALLFFLGAIIFIVGTGIIVRFAFAYGKGLASPDERGI